MLGAILFDFNGVIVDDEPAHCRAFAEVLGSEALTFTPEEYFSRYLGLDDPSFFTAFLSRIRGEPPGDAEIERMVQAKAAAYWQELEQGLPLFAGVAPLVRRLAAELPLAINSGARRHEIERILDRAGIADCFLVIKSADEVRVGKPDPEGYLAVRDTLRKEVKRCAHLTSGECLVVEDAPPGIRAAHAAGMKCVAVANSRPATDLSEADAVVSTLEGMSLADLQRLFDRANSANTT